MKRVLLISLVLILGLAASVWADMIPVPETAWTGSRSIPETSGVIAYDGWTNVFKISWEITFTSGAEFPYSFTYELTDLDGNRLVKFPSFKMTSRNYVLSSGKIIAEGPGEQLLQNEVLRKTYLGL